MREVNSEGAPSLCTYSSTLMIKSSASSSLLGCHESRSSISQLTSAPNIFKHLSLNSYQSMMHRCPASFCQASLPNRIGPRCFRWCHPNLDKSSRGQSRYKAVSNNLTEAFTSCPQILLPSSLFAKADPFYYSQEHNHEIYQMSRCRNISSALDFLPL